MANGAAADRLRDFVATTRRRLGLTQEDVARRGGISRGALATIESDRPTVPRQETLHGIAKGLGVPYVLLDRIARGLPEAAATTRG